MVAKKNVFLKSFIITLGIFVSLILLNSYLDNVREEAVVNRMSDLVGEYEDMQSLMLMTDYLDQEALCVAIDTSLYTMNKPDTPIFYKTFAACMGLQAYGSKLT